ncbi:MAG TPA: asparagine synthase (glutamine-hydrolyzing) [Ferruginibacter sp.]|nr:asparagine synthase (glutamine-hydrolyzing) [Ferruginibacter sp.]
MCGIAGIIALNKNDVSLERVKKMTDIIAHRGPDGEGHWVSDNGHVALGHRRLSIIDLSHAANQPMKYAGRYSMVFNGEIYNYIELKESLLKQGCTFTTSSDTEVLLALYHRHKEACLQMLDGMFAFVIYDTIENEIFVARDRFGEKPFFFSYEKGNHFLFASEMKALWAAGINKEVNNRMLFNYLETGQLNNINDQSETFFINCSRLPHSHYLKLNCHNCTVTQHKYYDINWENTNHSITQKQASEKFQSLFYNSVNKRLRSDVPVGSSLSGGLDSSLVVTVIDELKKSSHQKQATFSAVFPGFIKDERKYIDYVIAKTNVQPHFVTPTDDGLLSNLDKLSWHQEEPYGSASIYVQYCVMELAKKNSVTVLLDGQGADEILAGYLTYYEPYFNALKKTNKNLYTQQWDAYKKLHADNAINKQEGQSLKSFTKSIAGPYINQLRKFYRQYQQIKNASLHPEFYNNYKNERVLLPSQFQNLNHALYHSLFNISLQDLLRYADRNSMAHSREVRLPFLNHELVEFIFTLPPQMKINNGWTKWIMRETFTKELPKEITWRKDKIGYEPPQQSWMERKEVKEKIHEAKKKLVKNKIINPAELDKEIKAEPSTKNVNNSWRYWMAGEIIG